MSSFIEGFENKKRLINLFFAIIVFLSALFIYRDFLLNRGYFMYMDIGSDTFMQFYPYYTNLVLSIRDGSFSLWNWDFGVGASIIAPIRWLDPFTLVVAMISVVLGAGALPYLLGWMQVAKVLVCFFIGKKYFSLFLKNDIAIGVSSYLFALNGYLMLWGQHYYLGTNCLYMIFLLYGVELILRKRTRLGGVILALDIGICLLFSYYIGFMVLLSGGIYFLFRYFTDKETKGSFANTFFYVLDGILISSVIFIPACVSIVTNSTRLEGVSDNMLHNLASAFISSFRPDEIGVRLSRMLSNTMLGINDPSVFINSNYYESPQFFCTIFIFFFLGQWLIREIRRCKEEKTYIKTTVKLVLLYLMIFNNATSLILEAFSGVAYRNTFVAMPFLCLMVGIVIEEISRSKSISIIGLFIGIVLTGIGWAYSYFNCTEEVTSFVKKMLILIVFGYCLIILSVITKEKSKPVIYAFLLFAMFTTMLDGWYATVHRAYIAKPGYTLNWSKAGIENDTTKALTQIRESDKSFYRVEKTYYDWYFMADSYMERYSTSEWYHSSQNKRMLEFYDKIYGNTDLAANAMALLKMDGPMSMESLNLLHSKYFLSKVELKIDGLEEISRVGEVIVYRNKNTDQCAKWFTKTTSKQEYESASEKEKLSLIKNTLITDDVSMSENNSDAKIGEFSLVKQSFMQGHVSCMSKGILMLSITDEDGWDIYVDGVKQDRINCDYGFAGVALEPGEHDIQIKYHIPYGLLGLALSILGIVLLIVLSLKKPGSSFEGE